MAGVGPASGRVAGEAAHWAFYGLLLATRLSGLATWFLPSETVGGMHDLAGC